MFRVSLLPPGWLGRGFQLLAMAVGGPERVEELTPYEAVYSCVDDFIYSMEEAYTIAEGLLDSGYVKQPRLYGNDPKPLRSLLGLGKREKIDWFTAAGLLLKGFREGRFKTDSRRVTAPAIMKANVFEYARSSGKPEKRKREMSGLMSLGPAGLLMGLVGGVLSKVGVVGRTSVYLLPGPGTRLGELETVAGIYASLVVEEPGGLRPLGALLRGPGVRNLPVSLDVLLVVYGAALLAGLFGYSLCGAVDIDKLYMASVLEAGNRPMVAQVAPLAFSEPLCLLDRGLLHRLGVQVYRALHGGVCGGERDPGRDAVLACVGKVYSYAMTGNTVFLYDCARLLGIAAASGECARVAGLLRGIALGLHRSVELAEGVRVT